MWQYKAGKVYLQVFGTICMTGEPLACGPLNTALLIPSVLEISSLLQMLNIMTRQHKLFSACKPVYAAKINTTSLGRVLKCEYRKAWLFYRWVLFLFFFNPIYSSFSCPSNFCTFFWAELIEKRTQKHPLGVSSRKLVDLNFFPSLMHTCCYNFDLEFNTHYSMIFSISLLQNSFRGKSVIFNWLIYQC